MEYVEQQWGQITFLDDELPFAKSAFKKLDDMMKKPGLNGIKSHFTKEEIGIFKLIIDHINEFNNVKK